MIKVEIETQGQQLYPISSLIQNQSSLKGSGLLHLFCPHTSCGLLISEGYDPTAKQDLESFFSYIAPESLPFIEHTLEGPDDPPSHMKSALIQTQLTLFYENGSILLGQWQEIYLAEFRKAPHQRKIWIKTQKDLAEQVTFTS